MDLDLFLLVSEPDPRNARVLSLTEHARLPLPVFTFGDRLNINVYLVSADGSFHPDSTSALLGRRLVLGIRGQSALAQTSTFTAITNGYSCILDLDSTQLALVLRAAGTRTLALVFSTTGAGPNPASRCSLDCTVLGNVAVVGDAGSLSPEHYYTAPQLDAVISGKAASGDNSDIKSITRADGTLTFTAGSANEDAVSLGGYMEARKRYTGDPFPLSYPTGDSGVHVVRNKTNGNLAARGEYAFGHGDFYKNQHSTYEIFVFNPQVAFWNPISTFIHGGTSTIQQLRNLGDTNSMVFAFPNGENPRITTEQAATSIDVRPTGDFVIRPTGTTRLINSNEATAPNAGTLIVGSGATAAHVGIGNGYVQVGTALNVGSTTNLLGIPSGTGFFSATTINAGAVSDQGFTLSGVTTGASMTVQKSDGTAFPDGLIWTVRAYQNNGVAVRAYNPTGAPIVIGTGFVVRFTAWKF